MVTSATALLLCLPLLTLTVSILSLKIGSHKKRQVDVAVMLSEGAVARIAQGSKTKAGTLNCVISMGDTILLYPFVMNSNFYYSNII